MKNIEFNKKVSATLLDKNLQKAGLIKDKDFYGVSVVGNKTIVHLSDEFENIDLVRNIINNTGIVDRDTVKIQIDRETQRYINCKVSSINEDLTDLATELLYYLSKEQLNDYEQQRKQFIEKLFEWKEKVWKIEEEMEKELSNESIIVIKKKLWETYDSELGKLFEQVKSLLI
ncbi:hypothetical protein DRP04_11205 [Archaeoglobales archaeon]|nr:MAG: hypothetical protein DRP04_11205 [Archaeoglobales archaeon]